MFPVGIVLAVSSSIRIVASVITSAAVKIRMRMEVNVTTAIQAICVVAGTALLGRSGDMFPTLQGNAWIGAALAV